MSKGSPKQRIVLLSALALSLASLGLPAPTAAGAFTSSTGFHIELLIETFLAGVSIGAGILFLIGLRAFKFKLRVAYSLVAIGMVVYAVALIQLPILQTINLFQSPYVTDGWLNILYVAAALLMLVGILRYAYLLRAKTTALAPLTIVLVLLATVAVVPFLPHAPDYLTMYGSLTNLWINAELTAVTATLLALTTIGILVVKRTAGPAYTSGLAWSFLGIGFLAVATYLTVYFQLFGFTNPVVTSGLFFMPFLVGMLCNLRSAAAFNNIQRY